jgi:hypothetical protein
MPLRGFELAPAQLVEALDNLGAMALGTIVQQVDERPREVPIAAALAQLVERTTDPAEALDLDEHGLGLRDAQEHGASQPRTDGWLGNTEVASGLGNRESACGGVLLQAGMRVAEALNRSFDCPGPGLKALAQRGLRRRVPVRPQRDAAKPVAGVLELDDGVGDLVAIPSRHGPQR